MGRITAPICDFVRKYRDSGMIRMHMPGHKGRSFLGPEDLDITEIAGADALYEASGIIRESEQNASALFGTQATFYGTEGSSQMIRAMLYLAGAWAREKERENAASGRITILAARNVHKSFVQACALLDYDVNWLYGEEASYLSCRIGPETLEKALQSAPALPDAFFITSPDYLGKTADIRALSAVCRKYGVPMLVDNAHGAYLHFLPEPQHPMDLSADLCCDSAHKTLPVLTGGAYLHVAAAGEAAACEEGTGTAELRRKMRRFFAENARSALALFGSTSPSYLILQSLDLCDVYLVSGYRGKLSDFTARLQELKVRLLHAGVPFAASEPLKLTLEDPAVSCGLSGNELAAFLRQNGVECEFSDAEHLVLMLSPENTEQELSKLEALLTGCFSKAGERGEARLRKPETAESVSCRESRKFGEASEDQEAPEAPEASEKVLSIREAVFSAHETIPVTEAEGRIAGAPTVSCPPAVPIVISGERISRRAVESFRHFGIETVEVVREC